MTHPPRPPRIAVVLAALLAAGAASARPRVAVVQSDDLTAYTGPVPAFLDALGEPAIVVNLHGRAGDAEAIASRLRRDEPDAIFAVGAKAAWIVTQRMPNTPVVYAAVLDPARYGVETRQATGIGATVAPGVFLSQFSSFFPELRRVGVLRGPRSTEARMVELHDAAEAVGVELVVVQADGPRSVRRSFGTLAEQVDAVWLQPDRDILDPATFRLLTQEARRRRLPLLVETENMVAAGALFAVVPDPDGVGAQAAGLAARLLDGAAPAVVTPESPGQTRVVLNLHAARLAEIAIDPLLLDFVDSVVQ